MTVNTIPFGSVPYFSDRDRAYALGDERLLPFFKFHPSLDSFGEAIKNRSARPVPRELLVRVLRRQYESLERTPAIEKNIASLMDGATFTVVTAHQPLLFTGPLYFIFKIVSAINLAGDLRKAYPDNHFVPVMILGGEDHDFEEMNHAHLFGRKLVWEAPAGGPAGRMDTRSLLPVLDQLHGLLGESEQSRELWSLLKKSFTGHQRYGTAMQHFVNSFFKAYGLLVLNMDDPDLKRHFIPYMRRELLEEPSKPLVEETQNKLEQLGFAPQAYARPINLFYLTDRARERIIRETGVFSVVNTDVRFSEEEMLEELEAFPERFSPNVVLRPLYQESILPNLAYVGGGGELAYWLERKSQFEHFGLDLPVLIRRNSALWIDSGAAKRMEKLGVGLNDLMRDTEDLVKEWVLKRSDQDLSLSDGRAQLAGLFDDIAGRAQAIDPTLVGAVRAEEARMMKSLEQLEIRLVRGQKQRFDTELGQLRTLKEKLFPGNGLQERYDNFIPYYLRHGQAFFDVLFEALHPTNTDFVVIQE